MPCSDCPSTLRVLARDDVTQSQRGNNQQTSLSIACLHLARQGCTKGGLFDFTQRNFTSSIRRCGDYPSGVASTPTTLCHTPTNDRNASSWVLQRLPSLCGQSSDLPRVGLVPKSRCDERNGA